MQGTLQKRPQGSHVGTKRPQLLGKAELLPAEMGLLGNHLRYQGPGVISNLCLCRVAKSILPQTATAPLCWLWLWSGITYSVTTTSGPSLGLGLKSSLSLKLWVGIWAHVRASGLRVHSCTCKCVDCPAWASVCTVF